MLFLLYVSPPHHSTENVLAMSDIVEGPLQLWEPVHLITALVLFLLVQTWSWDPLPLSTTRNPSHYSTNSVLAMADMAK